LTIAGTSVIDNTLTLSAASLGGAGNLTVTGLFTWDSGSLSGPVGSSLTAQGGMTLESGVSVLEGLTLVNASGQTANWLSGNI
jgi:hypothetical protein